LAFPQQSVSKFIPFKVLKFNLHICLQLSPTLLAFFASTSTKDQCTNWVEPNGPGKVAISESGGEFC
jgi:hypothetical protein